MQTLLARTAAWGRQFIPLTQVETCSSSSRRPSGACREVHWPAELMHYAWHNRDKVQAMEAQLADFLGAAQKRRSLPKAPKQERHVMHQLAQAYGLATQSFGAEPARHIDVFKVSNESRDGCVKALAQCADLPVRKIYQNRMNIQDFNMHVYIHAFGLLKPYACSARNVSC